MKVLDETGTKKLVAAYKQADSNISSNVTNITNVLTNIVDASGNAYPYIFGTVYNSNQYYCSQPFSYNKHNKRAVLFEVHNYNNNVHGYIQITNRPGNIKNAVFISMCSTGSQYVINNTPFGVVWNKSLSAASKDFYLVSAPMPGFTFIKPIELCGNIDFSIKPTVLNTTSTNDVMSALNVNTGEDITTILTSNDTTTTTT